MDTFRKIVRLLVLERLDIYRTMRVYPALLLFIIVLRTLRVIHAHIISRLTFCGLAFPVRKQVRAAVHFRVVLGARTGVRKWRAQWFKTSGVHIHTPPRNSSNFPRADIPKCDGGTCDGRAGGGRNRYARKGCERSRSHVNYACYCLSADSISDDEHAIATHNNVIWCITYNNNNTRYPTWRINTARTRYKIFIALRLVYYNTVCKVYAAKHRGNRVTGGTWLIKLVVGDRLHE